MPLALGGHGHRRMSLKSAFGGSVDEGRPGSAGGGDGDETVVDEGQGNVLSHIISQLRPGADLSRVTLPTFILEPRSMLERITNFMAHPERLLHIPEIEDPVERFVDVVKFYLSGWHIRPPGVKKPLNPILGEVFTGYWDYEDGTQGYYISEQTSHHPPKSSYYFAVPKHNIRVDGTLKPRSKFLGNSVGSFMEGIAILRLTNRTSKTKTGERYFLTQPNMYARGILFGKMKYELGDHTQISCPENHLVSDIEFKTKGWVGGGYNIIAGTIKNEQTGQVLYELSGNWTGEMFVKDVHTGKKDLFFDATNAKHTPPKVRPIEEQHDRESQKLWAATNKAIREVNHEAATDAKTAIEEQQRAEAAQRHESGEEWHPKLFRAVPPSLEPGEENLDWILNAEINGTPDEMIKQILSVYPILPGQELGEQSKLQALTHDRVAAEHSPRSSQQATLQPPAQQQEQPPPQQPQHLQQPMQVDSQVPAGRPGQLIDLGSSPNVPKAAAAMVGGNYAMLSELHKGEAGHPVVRPDTETGGEDEFVDAQG